MDKLSVCKIDFLLLLLTPRGLNYNLLELEASSHGEEVYFSDLLIAGDTFVWQMDVLRFLGDPIDTYEKSPNNLLEGSTVNVT